MTCFAFCLLPTPAKSTEDRTERARGISISEKMLSLLLICSHQRSQFILEITLFDFSRRPVTVSCDSKILFRLLPIHLSACPPPSRFLRPAVVERDQGEVSRRIMILRDSLPAVLSRFVRPPFSGGNFWREGSLCAVKESREGNLAF
jgi:hypothetical protein